MSVQVTLTISDALYHKARAQAQLTNQDPADILAGAIVLGETPSMLTSKQVAMAKEKAACDTPQGLKPRGFCVDFLRSNLRRVVATTRTLHLVQSTIL